MRQVGTRTLDDDQAGARQPLALKRALLAYAIVILAALWAHQLWEIRNDRQATLDAALVQLATIATAVSTHFAAIIYDGVGAANAGANEINAQGGPTRLPPQDAAAILQRMLTGGDYVRELFFSSPTLFVSASRNQARGMLSHPDWADELLTQQTGDTWVGHPLNIGHGDAPGENHFAIPIALRIPRDHNADQHSAVQWAGAIFSTDNLQRLYHGLVIEHGGVSLVSINGEVLLRATAAAAEDNVVGRNFATSSAFKALRLPISGATTLQAPNPLSGEPRLFAVQKIPGYPLLAVAGRDVNIALLLWRERSKRAIELAVVGSVALLILTVILYRLLSRRYEALRKSEERFQLAVAGSNDGIWDWDVRTNHVYYSARLKEKIGVTPLDNFPPFPESFYERMHPDDLESIQQAVRRHVRQRDPYKVEYRVRVRDGSYRWFSARAQAVWDAQGNPRRMAGSISDIHERKTAEQSLRQAQERELHVREEFTQNLLLAQEQERQRLANELHDSVGQNLSLIKSRALLVLQQQNLSTETTHHVNALSTLATDVIAEVRAVAQNLRPLHIEQLGLTDALDTLLNKMSESSVVRVERRLENVDDVLTGTAATHLFRIFQEALNNILKHAQATQCRVWLERDLHCVRLTITDNGRGFEKAGATPSSGLGLASIAERARMLAAKLQIDSGLASGTTIGIEIPVADGAMTSTNPSIDLPA